MCEKFLLELIELQNEYRNKLIALVRKAQNETDLQRIAEARERINKKEDGTK